MIKQITKIAKFLGINSYRDLLIPIDQKFIFELIGIFVLTLIPSTVFYLISGQYLIFLLISSAIVIIIFDNPRTLSRKNSLIQGKLIIISITSLLWVNILLSGSFSNYWVYPQIVVLLLILPLKASEQIILLFLIAILPLIYQYLDIFSSTRIITAQIITTISILTFSFIVVSQRQPTSESEKKSKTPLDASFVTFTRIAV